MRRGQCSVRDNRLLTRFFKRHGHLVRHAPSSQSGEGSVSHSRPQVLPKIFHRICRFRHLSSNFRRDILRDFRFASCHCSRSIVVFIVAMVRRLCANFNAGFVCCLFCFLWVPSLARVKSAFRCLVPYARALHFGRMHVLF